MKRDSGLNWLWLKCINFANFTKSYYYVNLLLKSLPEIWKGSAVANCHKLDCLNKHKFILLQLWRSEFWNGFQWARIKVLAGLHFFWRLNGRICFFALSVSSGCVNAWLLVPFSKPVVSSLSFWFSCSCFSFIRVFVIIPGPKVIYHLKICNLIRYAKSLLLWHVT